MIEAAGSNPARSMFAVFDVHWRRLSIGEALLALVFQVVIVRSS